MALLPGHIPHHHGKSVCWALPRNWNEDSSHVNGHIMGQSKDMQLIERDTKAGAQASRDLYPLTSVSISKGRMCPGGGPVKDKLVQPNISRSMGRRGPGPRSQAALWSDRDFPFALLRCFLLLKCGRLLLSCPLSHIPHMTASTPGSASCAHPGLSSSPSPTRPL